MGTVTRKGDERFKIGQLRSFILGGRKNLIGGGAEEIKCRNGCTIDLPNRVAVPKRLDKRLDSCASDKDRRQGFWLEGIL